MGNTEEDKRSAFERHKAALVQSFREAREAGQRVRLGKRTSNLFRRRRADGARTLEVSGFNTVIEIDPVARTVDVGGMTPYDAVVAATLRHGLMPAVVPELKSITVGGAVTGGGIESSSFRFGFVHETVVEIEILTASGEVVLCRPDNAHSDLFFGFANSYGTLGYALRLRIELVPAGPYVQLTHQRCEAPETYFEALAASCGEERARGGAASFVDGVVFREGEMVRTVARSCQSVESVSSYRFMRPFYHSIRERGEDWLSIEDYIWRWDTDWFWCARAFGMERPWIRFPVGLLGGLNSRTYWKIRHVYENSRLLRRIGPGRGKEWVIQDVEIPVDRAAEFQHFLCGRIGIFPFWICPAKAYEDSSRFPLYQTDPETLYINFGFWGGLPSGAEPDAHNRLVETKVQELGGKKSLYSTSHFSESEFWEIYNQPAYRALKNRYDPEDYFPDLYQKCVLG
ncbi:MAG: FAD-binding protein [Verrucomicrobia bacterium]|nr:FAD-binding protein [Verrucomicrobiota bacterium]